MYQTFCNIQVKVKLVTIFTEMAKFPALEIIQLASLFISRWIGIYDSVIAKGLFTRTVEERDRVFSIFTMQQYINILFQ